MRYFKCHQRDVDVDVIQKEIAANPSSWAEETGRQQRVAVQAETNAIPLRGLRRSKIRGRRRRDVHETRYTSLAKRFPETVAMLETMAACLGGRLGRAKFARLPAGARVMPHVDRGDYYARRDRYHLVVDSTGESTLSAGNEEVGMRVGELWWFDNKAIHSAHNASARSRTHLVFDIEPAVVRGPTSATTTSLGDPRELLTSAHNAPFKGARESIASAVELYLAVRADPVCWEGVLREHDCVERAQRQPIEVLTRLLWPSLDEARRKRRESAVAWAIAQLDLGRLTIDQIPKALQDAGGIRQLHDLWRTSKDQLLYGTT